MKKRIIALILTLCLVSTLGLVGCSNDTSSNQDGSGGSSGKSKDTTQGSDSSGDGQVKISEPGQYPITSEKVTLNVLIQGNAAVEDFNTNEFTLWYEEKTNVHANFDVLPVKNGAEKLNLILASGDYPEILMSVGLTQSQVMSYGSQGIFIPLNNLIEKHGFEIKKVFEAEETEFVKGLITYPDGNIYAMPDINQCYHCSMAQKLWIYKPWLDKLGLEVPKTLDEYTQVLRAFKTQDPNGNGEADEIPLAAATIGWHAQLPGFFMCSFIYCDNNKNMIIKDGKIDVTFNKPEWKQGLEYLKGLYEEGLISPESFTQDNDQYRQMGENPDIVILGSGVGGHQGIMAQLYGESGRWIDYVVVPPLQGPGDKKPTCFYDPYLAYPDTVITDKCKHPEIAFKWIDGMYETEAILRSVFGRPDKEWRWAKEGEKGLNGKQAIYKTLVPWSETIQNYCWVQSGPQARTATFRLGQVAKEDEPLEPILYQSTKLYEPFRPDYTEIVPPLVFTEEQANELGDLEKTIVDFVEQMNARFITGDADLDNEWENYLQTLEDMGVDRFIEIYQQAYDLKYGNK